MQPFKRLNNRNLLYFVSNTNLLESKCVKHMFNNRPSVYIGFDPTAKSIHLGNYQGIVALQHFRMAGFRPIVLFGGATGLIGDPSGRSTERNVI